VTPAPASDARLRAMARQIGTIGPDDVPLPPGYADPLDDTGDPGWWFRSVKTAIWKLADADRGRLERFLSEPGP
jgi:hypothetical protein